MEQQLQDALLAASKEAVDMLGYYPRNFLEMLMDKGARQTAEELMTRTKMTHGLETLWEKKRLDLSIEAIVLENPYKTLFAEETLAVARKSLSDLKYDLIEYVLEESIDQNWTDDELGATIDAYFSMLLEERVGKTYNKSEISQKLRQEVLKARSKGSISFRMQNISFVLKGLGIKWVDGYKPAKHVGAGVAGRIKDLIFARGYLDDRLFQSTSLPEEYDERVKKLLDLGITQEPPRTETPTKTETVTSAYSRNPRLKAWILAAAKCRCEQCSEAAPFTRKDGTPGLELHHVIPLADGGLDGAENAVVLCPNCHKACHESNETVELAQELFENIPRLRHPSNQR